MEVSLGQHGCNWWTLCLGSLSETRWSRHAELCKAIVKNSNAVLCCLEAISKNEEENGDTRNEAHSRLKKVTKLETALNAIFWTDILQGFPKTSVALCKPGLDISTAVGLLSSLEGFVSSWRPFFHSFETKAHTLSTPQCYQGEGKRIVFIREKR